jgi:hypothetical protein
MYTPPVVETGEETQQRRLVGLGLDLDLDLDFPSGGLAG